MKKSGLIKIAVGLVVLAIFGLLFMRSLRDAAATAYTVRRSHLRTFTVALGTGSNANDPVLTLQPPPELASGLFRQVFARAMESLNTPAAAEIPLIIRGEFDRVLEGQLTMDALLTAARDSGLEHATVTPRCMVHRRISEPGVTRQVYFVAFDAPAILQFRQKLGLDPSALPPILFIAGADANFNAWLPQLVDWQADCRAPVEVTD